MKTSRIRLSMLLGALLAATSLARPAHAEPLHVRDVKLASTAEGVAEVQIVTTGTPQFTARVEAAGRRLVVDGESADGQGAPGAVTRGNALVGGVMTQGFAVNGQRTTRVMINLAHNAEYRVVPETGMLRVQLVAAEKTAQMAAKAQIPAAAATGAGVTDVRFD